MKAAYIFFLGWLFAVANAATLPFRETFDELNSGLLSTQTQWMVSGGVAAVQAAETQTGKAVELSGSGSISHSLSSANSAVWLTFWAKYVDRPEQNDAVTNLNTSVAFYINTNQHLVVYSNTTPVTLNTVIPSGTWVRFDVYCDYDAMTWNLSVNKTNVCAGLPLFSSDRLIDSILFKNEGESAVYVDEITVTDIEPSTDMIDADGDELPDWWEQKYFGGIMAADAAGSAGNGINTFKQTYIAGLNPFGSSRFSVSGGNDTNRVLRWTGQPGRRYAVYWTTNLLSEFTLLQADIPWTRSEFVGAEDTNAPAGFYQVRVGL